MSRPFSTDLFKNRSVVITGAGAGIGKATLLAFHEAGARIVAHLGRDERYAQGLPENISTFTGDFTQAEDQAAFIEHVKSQSQTIDVLVNNAGTMFGRFPADTLTDEQYQNITELNQSAVVRITRGLLPLLKKSPAASIINLSLIHI